MKTSVLKKAIVAIFLMAGMSAFAQSTCTAAFTYTVGSNGQVNFTNTSTGTGFMTNYYWDFGDNGQFNGASPSHTYSFNGGYLVTLTVMDSSNNCSSTFSDSVLITNAANNFSCAAGFTFTYGSAGAVNFTNTSVCSLSGHAYSWTFGDNSGSAATSPSHTYSYNGTYYATVQVTDSLGNGLCSYGAYVTITNGTPCNLQASFTWTDVGGGQVNFTNTSTGTNPNVVYSWNFGDNSANSTQASPSHTYQFNGPYTVYLSANDTSGSCSNSTGDSITVTSGTNPPSCNASFTYTLGASGSVTFSGSAPGTLTSPTYGWNFGDGGSASSLNPAYTYQYNGTYYVYFTATDGVYPQYSCSYYQPITISNTTNNPNNCYDSTYFTMVQDTTQASTWILTLQSNNFSSAVSAWWSWGDGTTGSGLNPTHTYTTAGWYQICVSVYYACGDSSSYCQNDSLYRSASQMVGVHVVNMITGIKNQTQAVASLKAYPNPFSDELKINFTSDQSKALSYAMYDMMGNQVIKERVNAAKGENELKLNTGALAKGVYFLSLGDGKKISTVKVVK